MNWFSKCAAFYILRVRRRNVYEKERAVCISIILRPNGTELGWVVCYSTGFICEVDQGEVSGEQSSAYYRDKVNPTFANFAA